MKDTASRCARGASHWALGRIFFHGMGDQTLNQGGLTAPWRCRRWDVTLVLGHSLDSLAFGSPVSAVIRCGARRTSERARAENPDPGPAPQQRPPWCGRASAVPGPASRRSALSAPRPACSLNRRAFIEIHNCLLKYTI